METEQIRAEEQGRDEEQIRAALNEHWRASAVGDARAEHDIYDENAVCDYPQSGERILGEPICRPCGVITPANRQVSTSSEFSVKVTSGLPNTPSSTRGDRRTPSALWSSTTVRSCMRHSISRIRLRRPPGEADGFSRWRDSEAANRSPRAFYPCNFMKSRTSATISLGLVSSAKRRFKAISSTTTAPMLRDGCGQFEPAGIDLNARERLPSDPNSLSSQTALRKFPGCEDWV